MNPDVLEAVAVKLQEIMRNMDVLDSRLEAIERRKKMDLLKRLREEESFFTYVESFVSLVSQVGLSDEDQVTLFVGAISYAKILTLNEDPYRSREGVCDELRDSVHPISWPNAKQGINNAGNKACQGADTEPIMKIMSRGKSRNSVYIPPHRRFMNNTNVEGGSDDWRESTLDKLDKANEDFGVDLAEAGLQFISKGKPKTSDVLDCTGNGDVDTSKVVQADSSGLICGASGTTLAINSSWKNPLGNWHQDEDDEWGFKAAPEEMTAEIEKFNSKGVVQGDLSVASSGTSEGFRGINLSLDSRSNSSSSMGTNHVGNINSVMKKTASDDDFWEFNGAIPGNGPIIDEVVWHDGEVWRVVLDTQSLENGSDSGETLSIVTDCFPHGTHVAGIATTFHPEELLLDGTGLTRALIAAVEHKCDMINTSYEKPTLFPDYGRFVNLVIEVVDKHRLTFVSSADNNGPALSTVGALGGTSSSIIGVGAYIFPTMTAGVHCVVEAPNEELQYTCSSIGLTFDGNVGVSISAPGRAVAPVPTWTLQRRMFMNGTSITSPSACGGVAMLLSTMKVDGIYVSHYNVRIVLENLCVPVGGLPEDKLSTEHGLIQVNKSFEYIKMSKNVSNVQYQVKITQSGTSAHTGRGIYLWEVISCEHFTEWTIQVEPKVYEDAGKLEEWVSFEECIELYSTKKAIVRPPEFLLLTATHNGGSFNIVVDPRNLGDGLHYFEVYGIDCKSPWRGLLFRIPITLTKHAEAEVAANPLAFSFSKMSFVPCHIEGRFGKVPQGDTWVEATMRTSEFDTTRGFFVDTVQTCPLQRSVAWESVVTLSSQAAKSFAIPVIGGQTMELVIARSVFFYSNMRGSIGVETCLHPIQNSAPKFVSWEYLFVLQTKYPNYTLEDKGVSKGGVLMRGIQEAGMKATDEEFTREGAGGYKGHLAVKRAKKKITNGYDWLFQVKLLGYTLPIYVYEKQQKGKEEEK